MAGCRGFALAIGVSALLALTGGVAEANQVAVIPAPAALHAGGRPFTLTRDTRIVAKTRAAQTVAEQLAGVLRPSTGYALPVPRHDRHAVERHRAAAVRRRRERRRRGLPTRRDRRRRHAPRADRGRAVPRRADAAAAAAGRGRGAHRPARTVDGRRAGGSSTSRGSRYRGAMLDVSRHFFTRRRGRSATSTELALYKINTLHLHLSDDQGWRIEIDALAAAGDRTAAAPRSAAARAATTPRRSTRTSSRYAAARLHHDRARDRHARPHQRGARVVRRAQLRRRRAAAVHRHRGRLQLAVRRRRSDLHVRRRRGRASSPRMTPGPYLHIGGDEAHSTPARRTTCTFMNRVQPIVARTARPSWAGTRSRRRRTRRGRSPSTGAPTARGAPTGRAAVRKGEQARDVAGQPGVPRHEVRPRTRRSAWTGPARRGPGRVRLGPGDVRAGVRRERSSASRLRCGRETMERRHRVHGVPAPAGIAEIGWSPAAGRTTGTRSGCGWRRRARGGTCMGINFYRSPQVPWR